MQINNNDQLQNTVFIKGLELNPNDLVLEGILKTETDIGIYISYCIEPVPEPE